MLAAPTIHARTHARARPAAGLLGVGRLRLSTLAACTLSTRKTKAVEIWRAQASTQATCRSLRLKLKHFHDTSGRDLAPSTGKAAVAETLGMQSIGPTREPQGTGTTQILKHSRQEQRESKEETKHESPKGAVQHLFHRHTEGRCQWYLKVFTSSCKFGVCRKRQHHTTANST